MSPLPRLPPRVPLSSLATTLRQNRSARWSIAQDAEEDVIQIGKGFKSEISVLEQHDHPSQSGHIFNPHAVVTRTTGGASEL